MKKRHLALAFLAAVLGLVAASLAVLRTAWAGGEVCALAERRLREATGLEVVLGSCRIEPLRFELTAERVRVGPADAPAFAADAIAARLAAVQALGGRVRLAQLRLVRPRVAVRTPPGGAAPGRAACPPPFLESFEIGRLDVSEGSLDIALPGLSIRAPRVDVTSDVGGLGARLRALARAPRASHVEVETGPLRVEAGGRSWSAARLRAGVDVAHDLSGAAVDALEADVGGVTVRLSGSVRDLCAPSLDVDASAEGPASALAALAGRADPAWSGAARVEVRARGDARAPALAASATFRGLRHGAFVPGDGSAEVALEGDRLVVKRAEVAFDGGAAVARGTIRLARGAPAELEVELRSVDLAEVLARLAVPGAWVSLRLDGRGRLAGTFSPVALGGELAMDFRDLRVLSESYATFPRGKQPILEVRRGRVEGAVRVDAEALSFDGVRIAAGDGVATADARVGFSTAAGFRVRAGGTADLGMLGHVAGVPIGGLATVDATVGAAPYGSPTIAGHARAERLRVLDVDLGTGAADFACDPSFVLRFTGAEGIRNATRWRGEVALDLRAHPVRVPAARFEATGRLRDLFDAVMDWLPRTRLVRDVMDGEVEVSGTASGPAAALDGEFDARLGPGRAFGRAYDSGRVAGRLRRGEEAYFERAELRRRAGVARARGRWGLLLPFPWDLEVEWSGLALADLDVPGGGWTGSASGTAALTGSTERPTVKVAANGDAVTVQGIPLGTVQAGATLDAGRLVVTGTAEGLRFTAEARTAGAMPYRARAELALDDVGRLLPGGAVASLRARVEGNGEVEGTLAHLEASRGSVRLDRVSVGYSDFRVENAGPVEIAIEDGGVEVRPFTLRGANTELTVGGTRGAAGDLDLAATGAMDLRLLAGLVPALRRPHGQLSLEAHVGGTAADPVLVGAGHLSDGGFQLRDAAVVLSGVGGDVAFSQNRVIFDALTASVNGGRASLRGEVELARLAPARLRIEAALDDVPLAVPAALPATLTGRVVAEGTPETTTVSGLLHVVRARYTQDVQLEKRVLDLGRRAAAPPRPYDPSGEWLRLDLRVAVDGDVRVDNDLLRGGVRGDLTVTGTLASPGLVGTLAMTEGSRALFRGNEFLLSRAVVTFTDRHRVDATLDATADAQVRDYVVHLRLWNTLDDPRLQLTSDPALSEPDIITLLSLGFTAREVAVGESGVGGAATAAAAQALFAVSGLDEQVKRFLPPGGLVRDLDFRFTSGWSQATSQVEPRAELESWLLRDRLRLRVQAPLSGARGQKVQAEMRLGGNASVQYQWDNENAQVAGGGDHGLDLKLRWEWDD